MQRYRINKILRLLEDNNEDAVLKLIADRKYYKAIQSLSDTGSVKLIKTWGNTIVRIILLDHYATYTLERSDVWFNRIIGFLAGVATSVVAAVITALLLG